jgi:hypothetical protein
MLSVLNLLLIFTLKSKLPIYKVNVIIKKKVN